MSKEHKKPSGNLTSINLKIVEKNLSVSEIKVNFPEVKDKTEIVIIDLFIKSISNNSNVNFNCDEYSQNNEQDLDFTIIYKGQKSLLELTELVPNGMGKNGGYSKPANWINMNELSDRLIKIIEKKSLKYKGLQMPVDLLIYITDNNADLSIGAENYIKNYLNKNKHVFRKIYFMIPHPIAAIITELYPNNVRDNIEPGNLGNCIILK